MLAAISDSHRSPLLSSFSLLYSSSSWLSVENSKFGPLEKFKEKRTNVKRNTRHSNVKNHSDRQTKENRDKKYNTFSYLNKSINRTSFLAETTVDSLCHVNVIASSSPAAISSSLSLNSNGLRHEETKDQTRQAVLGIRNLYFKG